jgi:hypothetical protein
LWILIEYVPLILELSDHVEDGRVLRIETQTLHGSLEFTGVYTTGTLRIE